MWCRSCLVVLLGLAGSARAEESNRDAINVYADVTRESDSNLYRLPRDPVAFGIPVPAGSTHSDRLTDIGGGIDAEFRPAGQVLVLRGSLDELRFDQNSDLDHLAWTGRLGWDWASGSALTGQISTAYDRVLGGFVNNRVFVKDLIDHATDAANVRWAVGSNLAIRMALDASKVSHSAAVEQYQDNRRDAGRLGIEYVFPRGDTIGLDYREARAWFTDDVLTYTDKTTSGRLSYAISPKTLFDSDLGWTLRRYRISLSHDFSGGIGHVSMSWQPSLFVTFAVKGWREVGAYLNNESDYYVSHGGSASASWKPKESLAVSLDGRWERQDYRGSGLGALARNRQDDVTSGNLSVKWTPRKWVEGTLSGGAESRASSEGYFGYSDTVVRVKFRFIW